MTTEPAVKANRLFIPLIIIAVICALLLTIMNKFTREQIETNQRMVKLKIIKDVMPLEYTNDLLEDRIEIVAAGFFGTQEPITLYRARKNGKPVGSVFSPVIAKGYNDRIELAIGLSFDGTITRVHVSKHKETEGLGDQIDQNNSDWIMGFNNRSLENTLPEAWAVMSDGGEFDQISGATISPRGIINSVKKTLDYYEINQDRLYQ